MTGKDACILPFYMDIYNLSQILSTVQRRTWIPSNTLSSCDDSSLLTLLDCLAPITFIEKGDIGTALPHMSTEGRESHCIRHFLNGH